ncbi:MAG TPA: hypothetical protein VFA83_19995 [Acidimicrobiales bacterium]|nr:hypothetical protein [Acidimicrobiales bacterium]
MRRRMTTVLAAVVALATTCSSGAAKPRAIVTVPIAGRPSAVTVSRGLVWVADDQRGVIVTVGERSAKVVGAPIKVGPSPISLAADADSVWVGDATGTLTRIDARSRRVSGAPQQLGGVLSGVALASGAVWVVDNEHGTLVRVDPATMQPGQPVTLPDGAVRVSVDGADVWVTNGENTVTLMGSTPVQVGSGPIGVSARDGVVWVANSEDNSVSRVVAGLTGPVPAVAVAGAPIAVTAGADGAWVLSQDARRLTRLDVKSGRVLRTTTVDTSPRGIALTTARVWVVGVEPNVLIGVLRSALGGGA